MTGEQIIKILVENGWTIKKSRGCHHCLVKDGYDRLIVPAYEKKDLKPGLETYLLSKAGLNNFKKNQS